MGQQQNTGRYVPGSIRYAWNSLMKRPPVVNQEKYFLVP